MPKIYISNHGDEKCTTPILLKHKECPSSGQISSLFVEIYENIYINHLGCDCGLRIDIVEGPEVQGEKV